MASAPDLEIRLLPRLFPGEIEAVRQVLSAGRAYGFGNLIAHLQTEWCRTLMREFGLTEEQARAASGGPGYPLDWDFCLQ